MVTVFKDVEFSMALLRFNGVLLSLVAVSYLLYT